VVQQGQAIRGKPRGKWSEPGVEDGELIFWTGWPDEFVKKSAKT
jgi:hypothetical protein